MSDYCSLTETSKLVSMQTKTFEVAWSDVVGFLMLICVQCYKRESVCACAVLARVCTRTCVQSLAVDVSLSTDYIFIQVFVGVEAGW